MAAAAAESGMRGPGRSREEPGAAGRGAEVETGVKITARSRAGSSNPKGQSWSPSPANWEKIKAETSEEVGGQGEWQMGCCNCGTGRAWGRRREEAGGGGEGL